MATSQFADCAIAVSCVFTFGYQQFDRMHWSDGRTHSSCDLGVLSCRVDGITILVGSMSLGLVFDFVSMTMTIIVVGRRSTTHGSHGVGRRSNRTKMFCDQTDARDCVWYLTRTSGIEKWIRSTLRRVQVRHQSCKQGTRCTHKMLRFIISSLH